MPVPPTAWGGRDRAPRDSQPPSSHQLISHERPCHPQPLLPSWSPQTTPAGPDCGLLPSPIPGMCQGRRAGRVTNDHSRNMGARCEGDRKGKDRVSPCVWKGDILGPKQNKPGDAGEVSSLWEPGPYPRGPLRPQRSALPTAPPAGPAGFCGLCFPLVATPGVAADGDGMSVDRELSALLPRWGVAVYTNVCMYV